MDLSALAPNPTSQQAQADLGTYYGVAKKPIDIYNEAVNTLGIPDARARLAADRKAINDTQGLVDAVDPSVTGRTQGSLVTEAQRQALVGREKSPLLESLSRLGTNYTMNSSNLTDLMGQANTQAGYGMAGENQILEALLQRLGYAQSAEDIARQQQAAAAQNAWVTALQEQLASMGTRIDDLQSGADDLASTNRDLWLTYGNTDNYGAIPMGTNTGMQGMTYNPQSTYNPMPATYSPAPATYSPQLAVGGINTLANSPLKVLAGGNNQKLTVSTKPDTRKLAVSSAPKNTGLKVVY